MRLFPPASGGITPACAGKRLIGIAAALIYRDHPRVCGEKMVTRAIMPSSLGSPPRVRGKDGDTCDNAIELRITPACAGKRFPDTMSALVSRDHPRVCGEKIRQAALVARWPGSPPRVRGKGWCESVSTRQPGITPACAGKSGVTPSAPGAPGDHPRVCGEKPRANHEFGRLWGSPPRVRGKGRIRNEVLLWHRITPACAGKSLHTHLCICQLRDHPRVCGEKCTSSLSEVTRKRITPACAWKSRLCL